VTTVVEETDAYRRSFDRSREATPAGPEWLRARRASAFERFVEKGLPSPRDEAWRQTPIGPITRARWEPVATTETATGAARELVPSGDEGPLVVLVGGRLSRELSRMDGAGDGMELRSLEELLDSEPDRVQPHLERAQGSGASVFADLNTSFASDAAVVFVAPGAVVTKPLRIVHLATPGEAAASYSRVLVVAGRGSECRVVETFTGPAGSVYLANAVTEVLLEDNSFVDHYKLQLESEKAFHLATLSARLGRDARFADHSFSFGAAIGRNDIDLRFDGEGGEGVLNGLFMVDGARLCDTHSRVDHASAHCSSREHYRGVLDGSGRGVFNALVQVRPGAQKTDAEQMNRNLLLSPEALVHSVPQLEILADDVKCRHGSTTGQLDPVALFYLRSRGIGEAEARGLLTWAFASDLVHGLPVPSLRAAVEGQVQARLGGVGPAVEAMP
jgi:Fe-S cluster assembly protein SufD